MASYPPMPGQPSMPQMAPPGQPPIPTAPHPVLPPLPAGMIPGLQIPGGPNNPYYKIAGDIRNTFGPPGGKSVWNRIAYALLNQNLSKYKGPAYNVVPPGVTLPPNPYPTGGQGA